MPDLTKTLKTVIPYRFLPIIKKTIYSLRSIYFSGIHFQCPYCKGHFRQMLPFGLKASVLKENEVIGGGYRENCLCPKCNSSDRERLVYLYLFYRTILLLSGISVFHIAPEINLANVLSSSKIYLSADLNSPLAMMKMDITEIPLRE
jgi:hypothetical protein